MERVIRMHPAVEDVRCSAEPHPILGLVPVAEFVAKSGTAVEPADLLRLVTARMEPHAIPRRMVGVPRFELADSGKRRTTLGPPL